MTELADTMKSLKGQWAVLKDDTLGKDNRTQACKRIIELSELAKKHNKKFEIIDMNNTQYAEFVPKDYKVECDVKWEAIGIYTREEENALALLKRLESISVAEIHRKLPNEAMDSQKFGMIVSAYTEKLVHIYCTQNFS
jgi:hypothetical protein